MPAISSSSPDPRAPPRILVKRVAYVDSDGYLVLAGDHPAHATGRPVNSPTRSLWTQTQ